MRIKSIIQEAITGLYYVGLAWLLFRGMHWYWLVVYILVGCLIREYLSTRYLRGRGILGLMNAQTGEVKPIHEQARQG